MESDNFTRHYIIRYLSARELVLPPLLKPRPGFMHVLKAETTSDRKSVPEGQSQTESLCLRDNLRRKVCA